VNPDEEMAEQNVADANEDNAEAAPMTPFGLLPRDYWKEG